MKACFLTMAFCVSATTAFAQFIADPTNRGAGGAAQDRAAKDQEVGDADAANGEGREADGRRAEGLHRPAGGAMRGAWGPPNPMFEIIDTNGDGEISKVELRRASFQLRKLDADGDGKITLAEVAPQGGPGLGGPMGPGGPWGDPEQMIDAIMQSDQNGDGKLTADELPGPMAQQMVQNGDKDGDQALSREELTQAMQEMHNRMPGGPGGAVGFQGGPGAFADGPGGGAGQRQMIAQWMQYDRNGDSRLSADEVPPQAMGMLRGGDQNNDRMIDAAELQMILQRNGERMRAVWAQGAGLQQNPARSADPNANGRRGREQKAPQ